MAKLIKLHPLDNVQIVVEEIIAGEKVYINNVEVVVDRAIAIGHKVSERNIAIGDKIIKYGVPIGSAITIIEIGSHIHLHNMKSDYIPTYTIEKGFKTNQY